MLNERDIDFIKENRKDVTQGRTETVTLINETPTGAIDPLTGEPRRVRTEEEAECTWSNLTSGGPGSDDIVMVAGVIAEAGDAIANFDIEVDMENAIRVIRRGDVWRIRSLDPVGLGRDNRHYVLLRRMT